MLASRIEARLQSLDDAFLFSIGSTSVAFAFLEAALGGMNALLLSTPLLIAGLFFPFYIGYLRGAIVVDTILERIRGWIYFTAGTSIYAAGLAVIFLRDLGDISLLTYLALYGCGFALSRGWIRSILRSTGTRLSNRDLVVLGATVGATIALIHALLVGEELLRLRMKATNSLRPQDVVVDVGYVAFVLLAFLIIERASREMAVSGQEIDISYDVNSLRGAIGQVGVSSMGCFLKGAVSDKRGLVSAVLSFLAFFALVTASLVPQELDVIVVAAVGLFWLATYLFALYRYAKIKMKNLTTAEISRFGGATSGRM